MVGLFMAAEKPTRVRDLSPRARLEAEQAIMRRYPGTMLALIPASIATGFLVLALMTPAAAFSRASSTPGRSHRSSQRGCPCVDPCPSGGFARRSVTRRPAVENSTGAVLVGRRTVEQIDHWKR